MTAYEPQVGDRVSLTGTVMDITESGQAADVAVDGAGRQYIRIDLLSLLERPKPPEQWRLGDVVRNADDESDRRIWTSVDETDVPWMHDGDWRARSALPANLLLLVRDGQPVPQPGSAETAHPQPGDVVTEEPPVGSVVRDNAGDEVERDDRGWLWSHWVGESRKNSRRTWATITSFGPLTLVRWGGESK